MLFENELSRSEGLKYATFRNYYYKLRSLISPPQEEAVQNFLPVLVSAAQSAHSDASVAINNPRYYEYSIKIDN
jgi:hypothetical protein